MEYVNGIASQMRPGSKTQVNVKTGVHEAVACDGRPTQVDETSLH